MTKGDNEFRYAAEGRLLAAVLDERGLGPSEFSRMIHAKYKLKSGPQIIQFWRKGRGFNETNRAMCADLLGLPPDAFEVGAPTAPAEPAVKHPALRKLLKERKLRRYTLDALRALESVNRDDPGEQYWTTQADWHEGIAAAAEASRFRPPPAPKPKKSASTHRT